MATKWTEENKQALLDLTQSDTPLAEARAIFYYYMSRMGRKEMQDLDLFDQAALEFEATKEIAKVLGIEFNPGGTIKEVTND
jgi:hypothetical protein